MTNQPEALRLAHELECRALISEISLDDDYIAELDAARVLREQHAEIERLREQLRLANIDALNESAENAALRAEVERLRNDLSNIQFQAQLVRDYVLQLNDDCDAAVKRCKP